MKLIDNILYIEFSDFISAGWKEDTVWKANLRNGSNWQMIKNPKDKRKPLVQYDTLTDDHKSKLTLKFGNVYEWVVKQPIKEMLKTDPKAETTYLQYKYNDTQSLPIKKVKQYTRASQWLTMLNDAAADIKTIKKALGINIPTLYKHVTDIMEVEKSNGRQQEYMGNEQLPGDFGTSYKRLLEKQKAFASTGYTSIIDKMYGNQLAAKINDEVSEAKLLSLLQDGRQLDEVAVCMFYNVWANENGYKHISPATVGLHKRQNSFAITAGRYGAAAFNEKHIRQVKGLRPSQPLYLVEHDDNNLDFLFKDVHGNPFRRYVAIVVSDSYCDLVLGKSYIVGSEPLQEQVYHAYLDAMYYIRSLTGGWYMPFEIKADKWASKSLKPLYDSIAKFIPPSHGNKHRGYIEQLFGSHHWKRSQQLASDKNWTANNMTAKHLGYNKEEVERHSKFRPMIGNEAEIMIENFFTLLRKMPDFKREEMNAPSKEQKWLDAFNQLPLDKKRPITDEQFLLTFGIKHAPQGRGITITNRGVEVQIGNTSYGFDLPENWMYNDYVGQKVNVVYDPYDMSRVLVTNEKDIRFIATTEQLQPRALQDAYTGSRTYLNAVLAEKKEQVDNMTKAQEKRHQLVNTAIDPEAILKGGVLVKNIKGMAEQKFIEQQQAPTQEYENFIDERNDLSQFFSND